MEAAVAQCERLTTDSEYHERVGTAARDAFEQSYSIKAVAAQYAEALRKAL
jgi:hypothetical protein